MDSIRVIRRAVITGPAGAIGIDLCNRLCDGGIEVYAVCNLSRKRQHVLLEGVYVVNCNLNQVGIAPVGFIAS